MDKIDTQSRIQDNDTSPNKMSKPKEGASASPSKTFSRRNPVEISAEGGEVDQRFVSRNSSSEQGHQEIMSVNEHSHQGSIQNKREGVKYQPNAETD